MLLFSWLRGHLFTLFFWRYRGVYFQQALGENHVHLLLRHIHRFHVRFGEGDIKLFSRFVGHDQQRGLAGSELQVHDAPDLVATIKQRTTHQVAHIIPALLERCALESTRIGQCSVMLRTVMQEVEIDDGNTRYTLAPGVTLATMLALTNTTAGRVPSAL